MDFPERIGIGDVKYTNECVFYIRHFWNYLYFLLSFVEKIVFMYRIFLYLTTACLIIPLLSCQLQEREEPFCITYKILVHDTHPHKILISYNTSNRLQTFYCTEKEWTKEVCLHPDDIASLFVEDIFDPNGGYIFSEEADTQEEREWENRSISAQIIHEKKIILVTGKKQIRASLLKSETE